jgi:serine/threonine protein kinase
MEDSGDVLVVPDRVANYQIMEALGSGAFATVYRARHLVTDCVVALKTIPKRKVRTQQEFELLQREVNLMKIMDHPFIASLFEVLDDVHNFYLAIELVRRGNLLDYINDNKGLPEKQACRIFYQLCMVLDYLHNEKRVVHRDLKAENVLLDENYNIRVVDFGLSKGFSKANPYMQTTCGSPAYVSPEIIKEEPYTAAADIWSAGVLLYAMVCGQLPFDGDNLTSMLQAILFKNPVMPAHLSPNIRSLLLRVLVKEPRARIKVTAVLQHPWLAELDEIYRGLAEGLKVQDAAELDESVLAEMKALRYDTAGLMDDLRSYNFNEGTAAYKMLRTRRITEEIVCWQKARCGDTKEDRRMRLPDLQQPAKGSQQRFSLVEEEAEPQQRLSLVEGEADPQLPALRRESNPPSHTPVILGLKVRKRVGPARPVASSAHGKI